MSAPAMGAEDVAGGQVPKDVLGYVRLEKDHVKGLRTLRTIKSFWVGEVALREKPFLSVAPGSTDYDRLRAYFGLDAERRETLSTCVFLQSELDALGIAVSAEDLDRLTAALREKGHKVDTAEARKAMQRWRFAARVDPDRIYEHISTLAHSCTASVRFEVGSGCGAIVARTPLKPQTWIGPWMLGDASSWWKGADARSEALQQAGMLPPGTTDCMCDRCQGDDTCRAIKCPGCSDYHTRIKAARCLMWVTSSAVLMACFVGWARVVEKGSKRKWQGELHRNGKLRRWRCNVCDFNASDTAVEGYIKIERKLVQDLSDISTKPMSQMRDIAAVVASRVGEMHWVSASVDFEICRRMGGDGMSCSAAWSALRIAEWILSRRLATPPQQIVDQLAEMMFKTLEFLLTQLHGLRDLRVCYLRSVDLVREVLEYIDKGLLTRFKPYAGAAQNIRRRCGHCQLFIRKRERPAAAELFEEERRPSDDVGDQPTLCGTCGLVPYCDLGCQRADTRRHRPYCAPEGADFFSQEIGRILNVA